MPKKPAKKSKQKSKKKKAKKGKTDETGLTTKEETILDVWKLMDENPLFNGMAKPTVDYIEYALRQQPLLKAMSPIERREHLLNIVILGFCRDKLFRWISDMQEEHGDRWHIFVEPKHMRLLNKIIETQEEIMPRIFVESAKGFSERDASKKIRRVLVERFIQIEEESIEQQPPQGEEFVDANYSVEEE